MQELHRRAEGYEGVRSRPPRSHRSLLLVSLPLPRGHFSHQLFREPQACPWPCCASLHPVGWQTSSRRTSTSKIMSMLVSDALKKLCCFCGETVVCNQQYRNVYEVQHLVNGKGYAL
jgi:transposase